MKRMATVLLPLLFLIIYSNAIWAEPPVDAADSSHDDICVDPASLWYNVAGPGIYTNVGGEPITLTVTASNPHWKVRLRMPPIRRVQPGGGSAPAIAYDSFSLSVTPLCGRPEPGTYFPVGSEEFILIYGSSHLSNCNKNTHTFDLRFLLEAAFDIADGIYIGAFELTLEGT